MDYTSDVMIGPGILRQVFDVYRKVRTTVRFLLGTIRRGMGGGRGCCHRYIWIVLVCYS